MVEIRKATEKDIKKVAKLCKEFFKTHNIFQQIDKKVAEHLKKESKKNILLVLEEKKDIKAAMLLVQTGQNSDDTHKIYKFRHFAFTSESYAKELLEYVYEKIKKSSTTAKIELTLAEGEKGIEFYKKQGYEKEADLKNHYRWGETCYVYSKSISTF